ncbi:DUF4232 domain-containing protein [Dactylosporangium sp. NPDC049742]|uniref:DUF4232 domain-containing protein n=1 Tax=Dactylosporangium sp. NPDC049742 TaxID=3154737 RepID=UPI0034444830
MTDRFETWLDEQQVELLAPPPGAYPSIARSARRRRAGRAVAGVAAATLAVAVAAGAVHQFMNAAPPPDLPAATPTAGPTAGPTEAPTTASTDGPTAAGSTGAAAPAGSATTQVTGRCRAGDLRVTARIAPGGGAAGGVYTWLVFTNTSGRTCSLYGFPGVSYVTGASGTQINEPATREGTAPVRVDLAPGQGAHAQVRTGQSSAYPDTCHPVEAAGYRVYVPDETASVFVPWRSTVCSTDGVNGMLIGPVYPGTNG